LRLLGGESSRIRYAKLAMGDAVGYFTGFSPVPIPLGISGQLWKDVRRRFPAFFVDWSLDNWPMIYPREFPQALAMHFKGKLHYLPQILYFDNTQNPLELSNFHLQLDPDRPVFPIPDAVRAATETAFRKLSKHLLRRSGKTQKTHGQPSFWDGKNLRLIAVEDAGAREKVLVTQIVGYHDYASSNLVLDATCDGPRSLRERIPELVEGQKPAEGALELLARSPLANNLGINILLFTADGALVMQKRSGGVAFRGRELCPAASGTVDVADLDPTVFEGIDCCESRHGSASDIRDLLREVEMRELQSQMSKQERSRLSTRASLDQPAYDRTTRELTEELEVLYSDLARLEFLGITRELVRGGEPELFLGAVSKLTKGQVFSKWKNAPDKWESERLETFAFEVRAGDRSLTTGEKLRLLERVDVFVSRYVGKAAPTRRPSAGITLLANVALWLRSRLGADWYS